MSSDKSPTLPDSNSAESSVWPGAFGIFNRSREVIRRNLSTFVALVLFTIVINMFFSLLFPRGDNPYELTDSLLSSLVTTWTATALVIAVLASIRDETINATDALKEAVGFYLRAIGLSILTGVITVLSLLALVVPFFFIYPRIILAPYFLVDKNLGPVDALKASWEATNGQIGKVWGVVLANILFAILIIVLIGIYFVFMYLAAEGLLYMYLTSRKSIANSSAAPVAPDSTATN